MNQDFFEYGVKLLHIHPPHQSDGSMVLRMQVYLDSTCDASVTHKTAIFFFRYTTTTMQSLGIKIGREFSFDAQSEMLQNALSTGAKVGANKIIEEANAGMGKNLNGWSASLDMVLLLCPSPFRFWWKFVFNTSFFFLARGCTEITMSSALWLPTWE
jgi:hypothetical protein